MKEFLNIDIADGDALLCIPSPTFNGSGLDDMSTKATFTGSGVKDYRVEIDSEGTPDTFKWSNNSGSTWEATTVNITGELQTLEDGVQIIFNATTGHTSGEYWDFSTAISVTENQISIQINWSDLDDDVMVVPLQSIDGVNYTRFINDSDTSVSRSVGISKSTQSTGSIIETLNGVRCNYLRLKVYVENAEAGIVDKIIVY